MQLKVPAFEPPFDSTVHTLRVDGTVVVQPSSADPTPPSILAGVDVVRCFHSADDHWMARFDAVMRPRLEEGEAASAESTPVIVEYAIELSRRAVGDEEEPLGLEGVLNWFARGAGRHSMGITGVFGVPEGASQSRFPLPIPVPTPELAAFDDVTAVELTKWADADHRLIQHSVVLQLIGTELQVVARTMVNWDWSEDLLLNVFDRTITLARSAAVLP